MKIKNKLFVIALITGVTMLFTGCKSELKEFSKTDFIMGTVCTISIYDESKAKAIDESFKAVKEIEKLMTIKAGMVSEITKLNSNAGNGKMTKLNKDTYTVLKRAIYFAKLTDGRFDPTIGSLTTKWNIGSDLARVPSKKEISSGIKLIDYKKIVLDDKTTSAKLLDKGMIVDLGGIAKGYAGDIVKEVLKKNGVKNAIINLGGNIVLNGENPEGGNWKVGIQDPFGKRSSYFGIINASDQSIVSSGIYERFLEVGSKRYHHILSTSTGYSTDNGVVATTIVADNSTDADGYSTSVFVLGVKKGLALLEKNNIDGMIIDSKRDVYITKSLKSKFKLVDNSYKIAN